MTVFCFAGPSLLPADRAAWPDIAWRDPAEAGDLLVLDAGSDDTVCLVDGYFDHRPAVRHKEILLLLSRGVRVLGKRDQRFIISSDESMDHWHAYGHDLLSQTVTVSLARFVNRVDEPILFRTANGVPEADRVLQSAGDEVGEEVELCMIEDTPQRCRLGCVCG